tara:strand:+ start:179 stop:352 length:174 start_codon:yes stop_codon:yes gene_type:complete
VTPQQLKIKRQFLGLTQEELAKMFLITARTIRNYETGATVIPKTFEMALNALELERK